MLIVGILLIVAGFFIDRRSRSMQRALRKYEFEHRSAGGAVEFSDFEASERHTRSKSTAIIVAMISGVLYLIGFILVLAGYFGRR